MKKRIPLWFRMIALCTALGLGGTHVWRQQQKAAPRIDKPDERKVLSGSKSAVITPAPLTEDEEEAGPVLMPGPKSGIFTPGTLMPGSKGGIIELKPEESKERVLMPGSKSFIVVPQERTLLPSSKSIPMPIFRERRLVPEEPPKSDKP